MPGNRNFGYYSDGLFQCIMNLEQQSKPGIMGYCLLIIWLIVEIKQCVWRSMFSLKSKLALIGVSLLIILLITACTSSTDASARGIYTVDPTFSDFYREFGGEDVLGASNITFI